MVTKNRVNLNAADYQGRAPIHVAAATKGSLPIVQYLCEQQVDVNQLDRGGRSALFIALSKGDPDVVYYLYSRSAKPIAANTKWAKMLCIFGFEGNLERLKLLTHCKCDLEISDYDLRNVGHLAASEGHYALLEYLASCTSFNFDRKDRWGQSTFSDMTLGKFSPAQIASVKALYDARC